jgi:hypothetical protein
MNYRSMLYRSQGGKNNKVDRAELRFDFPDQSHTDAAFIRKSGRLVVPVVGFIFALPCFGRHVFDIETGRFN